MNERSAHSIASKLEESILGGEFKDGDRLDETRLASEFGVSRTPLREALQKLVLSGMVEQIPRRGVFVRLPGPLELLALFELMAELEASCARLASSRISDEALRELRKTNRNCKKNVKKRNTDAYYNGNESFHRIIYRESGNQFLEHEALRLHQRLQPYRRIQLQVRGRLSQSMKEHELIVEALSEGDAILASELLRDHVAVQGDKFHHLIASLKKVS